MISAEERISLLKAITNAFEDDEMPYDGNSINHFEKHMIKFLDELRKPSKDTEEAARLQKLSDDLCFEFTEGGEETACICRFVKAGWQAKESREKELWEMLDRARPWIEKRSEDSRRFPWHEEHKWLADFEKMKGKKS